MAIKHTPDLSIPKMVLFFLAALLISYAEPIVTRLRSKRAVKSD